MTPRVICEVCNKEVNCRDAYNHVLETGHNSWTLEPAEDEEDTNGKMARS